jgi:SAM-dependent methyltransferase
MMWSRSVRPRIQRHLPTGTLLEIAPGFGRWTEYLLGDCEHLWGVDLTPRCVDVCQERFPATRTRFWVNDGESLPMIQDAAVDVAFSLDSLVHVDAEPLHSYIRELARTLKPGGVAFLHHSNLGAYQHAANGIPAWVYERHWRSPSVSARTVREHARHAGLQCVSQELINWIGRDSVIDRYRIPARRIPLTDCLSLLARPVDSRTGAKAETRVMCNRTFVDEWRHTIALTRMYAETHRDTKGQDADVVFPEQSLVVRWIERARREKASRIFAYRDPLVPSLRQSRCPDCRRRIAAIGACTWRCAACDVQWQVQ